MPPRIESLRGRRWVVAKAGGSRLLGFGLSVFVSAATALVSIPAMIFAGGDTGWGAIALGQAVGGVGAVIVGYGWGWFGPAAIAQASPTVRRTEYIESVIARMSLAVPAVVIVASTAYLLAPSAPGFAVAGAVQAVSFGLTATWYFVGLARPFLLLVLDTLPRSAGALVGVILIYSHGCSALAVPLGALIGMVVGFAISTIWILNEAKRRGALNNGVRSVGRILLSNRHGVISAFAMATYNSAPLAIVSIVAPHIQPAFALADKIRGQISTASTPAITVLQAWVPRATESNRTRRANVALLSGSVMAVMLGIGTFAFAPVLVSALSHDRISLPRPVMLAMATWVSLSFFQWILERAALATSGALQIAAAAITIGAVAGITLVYVGAAKGSLTAALAGAVVGAAVTVAVELFAYVRIQRKESAH